MPSPTTASKNRLRRETYAKLGDAAASPPQADPFSVNGVPGPLGLELLAKFAGMSAALARPVSLEDVMDGLRPRWAVGALARCVAAGLIEKLDRYGRDGNEIVDGVSRYAVTELGWEMRDGKRAA